MIYVNDNGELIEINRHDYVNEKQYYSKVSEMFKSYIVASEKDRIVTAKDKLENLETIETMVDEFITKNE